jgi:high-affinity K+ transport system ATPase subunit B
LKPDKNQVKSKDLQGNNKFVVMTGDGPSNDAPALAQAGTPSIIILVLHEEKRAYEEAAATGMTIFPQA